MAASNKPRHINKVVVFCGASPSIKDEYNEEGDKLGRLLGENGYEVIYGGGTMGLMGRIASAALAFGALVKGFIPKVFHQSSAAQGALQGSADEIVENMMIRKDRMILSADAGIAFPGGFGTLDEIYEMVVAQEIKVYTRPDEPVQPLIVINYKGFFDGQKMQLERAIEDGFIRPGRAKLLTFVDNAEQAVALLNTLNEAAPVPSGSYARAASAPPLGAPGGPAP